MEKYITQLNNNDIETFFNNNGYTLCDSLTDHDGNKIPSIERYDNLIVIRAQHLNKNNIDSDLAYYLTKKHPGFLTLSMLASTKSAYSRNIDLIHFSDYHMAKFSITTEDEKDSDNLCSAYYQYMIEKFPTYKADLLSFFEKESSHQYDDPTM